MLKNSNEFEKLNGSSVQAKSHQATDYLFIITCIKLDSILMSISIPLPVNDLMHYKSLRC